MLKFMKIITTMKNHENIENHDIVPMHLEFWFCTQRFGISTVEQTNKPRQAEASRGKPRN